MASLGIHTWFAVPAAGCKLPDAEPLNAALKEKFLLWEKNEGVRSSAPTPVVKDAVYESDFSLFLRDDPDIQRLAKFCLFHVGELTMRLNRYSHEDMRRLRIFHHSWFHITRHGGFTGPHNHPMASWSGVYCVTPGEDSEDHPESGALRMFDVRETANMYADPGNAYLSEPYAFGNMSLKLSPGQLILFPSYLFHEVAPFWGNDVRITVAFNCWLREAGQAVDEPGIRLRTPTGDGG